MATTAAGRDAQGGRQIVGGDVGVCHGDDEVIDAGQHDASVRVEPGGRAGRPRYHGAVDGSAPDRGGDGPDAALLARFGRVHRAAVRAEWRAAQAAGLEMHIEDDGRILLGAAPSIASTMFNRGLGLTEEPERVRSAVTFFERHGVAGDIVLDARDALAGVEPRLRLDAYVAAPGDVRPAPVEGVTVRPVGPDEAEAWMSVAIEANGPTPRSRPCGGR